MVLSLWLDLFLVTKSLELENALSDATEVGLIFFKIMHFLGAGPASDVSFEALGLILCLLDKCNCKPVVDLPGIFTTSPHFLKVAFSLEISKCSAYFDFLPILFKNSNDFCSEVEMTAKLTFVCKTKLPHLIAYSDQKKCNWGLKLWQATLQQLSQGQWFLKSLALFAWNIDFDTVALLSSLLYAISWKYLSLIF